MEQATTPDAMNRRTPQPWQLSFTRRGEYRAEFEQPVPVQV